MPQAIAAVVTVVKAVVVWGAAHPILYAVAKVAAGAVIGAITKPKSKGYGASGTQLSFKADAQAGMPFVLGRTATGGNVVFQMPSGATNKFMNFFVALSGGGAIEGIEGFTANKVALTFGSNGSAQQSPYINKMWMTTALGVAGATALAIAPALASTGVVSEWTVNHKLSGIAAARWTLQYDQTAYPQGVPPPLWIVKGVKVYDPRLDSTYLGGSGSHRANNPATWAYSENPYLHALTFCLGYYANGKRVGGVGVDPAMIDIAAFVAGANMADANAFKLGGVITSLDDKWAVLKTILTAGSGAPIQAGAFISCRYDAPRTSLATIQESDLAGAVTITAVKSRRERKNQIVPRYRSEAHNWEVVSADAVTSSTYQTQDGGLRSKEIEYALVQNAGQAAKLAAYDLVNAREFGPISLPLKPAWMGYRVGDCLTINLPELGLSNQKAVINQRYFDAQTGMVTLTFESETDSKHAFALGQSASPPPTASLSVDLSSIISPQSAAYSDGTGIDTLRPAESDADVTATATVAYANAPSAIGFACDYTGVVVGGQLPVDLKYTLKRGTVDVTASATVSILNSTGCTISINSSGLATITAVTSEGNFTVRMVYSGINYDATCVVSRTIAAPPVTGGGATTVSDTSFLPVSTASHIEISDVLTVRTGAAGAVALTAFLDVFTDAASPLGFFGVAAKWQWRAIGGTYADVAAEVSSSPHTHTYYDFDAGYNVNDWGSINATTSLTGLSANTFYEVVLLARRLSAGSTKDIYFSGNAVATGS